MKNKGVLKRVLKRTKQYRSYILLSVILSALTVALTLILPVLIGKAIDKIIGISNVDFGGIIKILTVAGIVIALTALLNFILGIINNTVTYKITRDFRTEAFNKLNKMPLSYIDTHPHGETVSRIISDIDTFSDGVLMGFSQLFTGALTILGTLGFMLYINPYIALSVVVLTPLSMFIATFIAKSTFKLFRRQSEIKGEQTALMEESLSGIKTIIAFSRENETVEKFNEVNSRLNKASLKAVFFSSLVNPTTRFVNALVYAVVALLGAIIAINGGGITVGTLSVFLSYANQYTKPFNEISGVITELQNSFACAERVFALIDLENEVSDDELPDIGKAEGKVEIENMSFSYTEERSLIERLNLKIKKGQRVAIVGPTGCGKTTLINLLMRFYEPTAGVIKVDNNPINQIKRKSLRSNYGMVLQDTWLKSGTIKENMRLSKEDATDEEIIEACKKANAHNFIVKLPNGYDTFLTENGGNLSTGQKQLLCIARVMLSLPPMLILDEATSSIDTRTELKIQEAFNTMMKGRTSFIVAHRLSTIRKADIILVMKDGNIIEQGTHKELMNKGGFYYTLYNSQFECV